MSTKHRRKKKAPADPGPALPLPPARPAVVIFPRKDRHNRLYARLRTKDGAVKIRATGCQTKAGAREWAELAKHTIDAGGSL